MTKTQQISVENIWNYHYFEMLTSNSCYNTIKKQEECDSTVSIVNQ